MEKVAGAGAIAGMRWEFALGCVAAAAATMLCPLAQAQDAARPPAEAVVAQARIDPPVRMEVQTSTLPRLDAQDGGFQAPRVDLAFTPINGAGTSIGPVLGLATLTNGPLGLGGQSHTGVDVGLRFSQKLQSQRQIDITAWRRMNAPDDAYSLIQMRTPVYGARVEMNLSAGHKSGLAMDLGFIGFQMESGARITIKRKDGRPMLYYRTTF